MCRTRSPLSYLLLSAGLVFGFAACTESTAPIDVAPLFHRNIAGERIVLPFSGSQNATPGDASGLSCPPGAVAGRNLVTGTGSPMGDYTGESAGCLVLTSPVTAEFVSLEGFLTAANGDQIFFSMDPAKPFRLVVTPDPNQPGRLPFMTTGENFIIGGTGRFADATGRIAITSIGDLTDPAGTVTTGEGRISVLVGAFIEGSIAQVAADVAALGDPVAGKLGIPLERAIAQVRLGHLQRAVERLRNFKGRVRLQMRKGTVTADQGQAFLDAVQPIIRELNRLERR